eukprot:TRINITY_DN12475_c0_g4_i7.p2 TRINITY_DN12475_c0_g4~~TRINITY_DN12475_c0_g4_i7.p2  ORF type:complete len:131 (+),score=0.64 TRINITY_DN12475_c0_g4_i7:1078-1470(+)
MDTRKKWLKLHARACQGPLNQVGCWLFAELAHPVNLSLCYCHLLLLLIHVLSSAAPACPEVCASQLVKDQDGQTRGYTWTAYDSLHVYGRIHKDPAPDTSISSVKLSYKMFIYGGAGGGCGPNFCCCRAP